MLKPKFEALPKLWPGLKGPQAITCHRSWPKSIFPGHYSHYWFTPRNVKDAVRRQPPNVPRLQSNPQAARKPPQFALWVTHSSAGGEGSGEGRARRGWPAWRGLPGGACHPVAGKKRPLPMSFWAALHRRQLQLFYKQCASNSGGSFPLSF